MHHTFLQSEDKKAMYYEGTPQHGMAQRVTEKYWSRRQPNQNIAPIFRSTADSRKRKDHHERLCRILR